MEVREHFSSIKTRWLQGKWLWSGIPNPLPLAPFLGWSLGGAVSPMEPCRANVLCGQGEPGEPCPGETFLIGGLALGHEHRLGTFCIALPSVGLWFQTSLLTPIPQGLEAVAGRKILSSLNISPSNCNPKSLRLLFGAPKALDEE